MDEYSRILSNPDNLIISEDLLQRIEDSPEDNRVEADLFLDENKYTCNIVSYSRSKEEARITLDVGNLDFNYLFRAKNICCSVCGEKFEFGSYFEYENSGNTSILILSTHFAGEDHVTRVL